MLAAFLLLLDVLILFVPLVLILVIFLPPRLRYRLLNWRETMTVPRFKTAASLLAHLESTDLAFRCFSYNGVAERVTYTTQKPLRDQQVRVSSALKQRILTLESLGVHGDTHLYDVDVLLPLARVEKLRLLVRGNDSN